MKKKIFPFLLILMGFFNLTANAQHVYPVTSGEMIFSQSNTSFTQDFLNQYPGARLAADNVRFTIFLHIGQYIHMDFSNSFGLYSGLGIRNVGMITDESLPQTVTTTHADVLYNDYKIIRRQYMLGVPLAFKVGSFSNHFYFFAGGEYEMGLVVKEKYWTGNFDRDGSKTKSVKWFSNQTPLFFPSLFAGVQFPRGVNLKFKYYLTDFLNNDYRISTNSQEGYTFNLSDLSRYKDSHIVYVSLCWQFNTAALWGGHDDY
jgi:hypothetical protein